VFLHPIDTYGHTSIRRAQPCRHSPTPPTCRAPSFDTPQAPRHWDTVPHVQKDGAYNAVLNLLPLESVPTADAVVAHLTDSVNAVQRHCHTRTCAKGHRQGDDSDCRMGFPRPLVNSSHFVGNDGAILLRRDAGDVVPYSRAVMLAMPGNHMFTLLGEIGRWSREHKQWEDMCRDGSTALEPRLPDAAAAAAIATEYTHKYAFKADNTSINTKLLVMVERMSQNNLTADQISRSVVKKALNKITGSMTVGTQLAASHILGHGDHHISHKSKVHLFRQFENSVVADGFDDDDVMLQMHLGERGAVHMTSACVAYTNRNALLADWSPVELHMCFELTKGGPFPLRDAHPLASTHGHAPRPRMVVPQFVQAPRVLPDGDADVSLRNDYGLFALSNFCSHDTLATLTGGNYWDKYVHWAATKPRGDLDEFAMVVLGNLNLMATARLRMQQDARQCRAHRRLMKEQNAEASADEPRKSWSDDEGGDVDVEDCGWDNIQTPLDGCFDLDDLMAQCAGASALAAPLILIPEIHHDEHVRTPHDSTVTYNESPEIMECVKVAVSLMKRKPAANDASPTLEGGALRLKIDTNCNPPTYCIIDPSDSAAEAEAASAAPPGRPPFVKATELPSIETTAALFLLCDEQVRPFRTLVAVLEGERAYARNQGPKPAQLRMGVLGQAGTGKSEVLKALQWHAYQHDMHNMIATCSQFWKAALLLSAPPHCPAYSVCSLLGINPKQGSKGKGPGTGDMARERCHSSVRLFILEEGGTMDQAFFQVGGRLPGVQD
jgi:hypothetical protein